MKHPDLHKPLVMVFCCSLLTAAAACAPASVTTKRIDKVVDARYEALKSAEHQDGNVLIPKQVVQWRFEGRTGEFLLAEVQSKQSRSCVVYIMSNGTFLPLGGNDHCSWASSPKLGHSGKKAWIEFRPIIKQPPEDPIPINEFTAHFQKNTGTVCMLGLPTAGYESLTCADDEAPDSQ